MTIADRAWSSRPMPAPARTTAPPGFGTQWRLDITEAAPTLMVEVANRSPEPDGRLPPLPLARRSRTAARGWQRRPAAATDRAQRRRLDLRPQRDGIRARGGDITRTPKSSAASLLYSNLDPALLRRNIQVEATYDRRGPHGAQFLSGRAPPRWMSTSCGNFSERQHRPANPHLVAKPSSERDPNASLAAYSVPDTAISRANPSPGTDVRLRPLRTTQEDPVRAIRKPDAVISQEICT